MRRLSGRGFAWGLAAIVVVALALRIAYALSQQIHLPVEGDSYVYSGGANALAQGRGWIDPFSLEPWPTASHPPLYTAWLWIASYVSNGHQATQLTHTLWSCIPGSASVLMVGLAGREMVGRRVGLVAAVVAALYPGMWSSDGLVLSETMAMFAVSGVLLFAYRYWNRPSVGRALWLGAWCGLAALARSELVLTFPLVLLPIVLLTRDRTRTVKVGWIVAAGLVGLAVLSPWLIFNSGRFHHRVLLSSGYGRTMAAANCDETYNGRFMGFKNYECLSAAQESIKDTRGFDESDYDIALRTKATHYVEDHIPRLGLVVLARWGRILQVYQPRQEIDLNGYYGIRGRWGTELQFWSFYVMVGLAIAGGFVLRRWGVLLVPLLAIVGMTLFAVAITFAQWRYRAPAEPALVLLAAATIESLIRRRFPSEPAESAVVEGDPAPSPAPAALTPVSRVAS